ncbi:MAG: hypothetical protein HRU32_10550 [Rhodobacteraceae bacterium]|nr:hypothetical protein [Paracoccaceae bacterium]
MRNPNAAYQDAVALIGIVVALTIVGAFVFLFAFIGSGASVEAAREEEQARRAACTYVDQLEVTIGGHRLILPAADLVAVFPRDGRGYISAEPTKPRAELWKTGEQPVYAFCLTGQATPIVSRRIAFRWDYAKALSAAFDFGDRVGVDFSSFHIGFQDVPPPLASIETAAELILVREPPTDATLTHVATAGITEDGFRFSGYCSFVERRGLWSCQWRIRDHRRSVVYGYWHTSPGEDLLGAPIDEGIQASALKVRALFDSFRVAQP